MQSSPAAAQEAGEGTLSKVAAAQAEVAELEAQVARERQAFAQTSANLVASTTHFDLQVCCYSSAYTQHLAVWLAC